MLVCVGIYMYVWVYIYVCVFMYVYMVYMCTYIYMVPSISSRLFVQAFKIVVDS